MDSRKTMVLALLIVSVFIFLVTVLVFVYALYSNGQQVPALLEPFLEYHIHFMVLMGLFGVISGLLVYGMLNSTIEKQQSAARANIALLMKFLEKDDREVVSLMASKDGMTTQSEIAGLPSMTRLKAHRVARRLEARGLIHVEKYGKINVLRLVEELRQPK